MKNKNAIIFAVSLLAASAAFGFSGPNSASQSGDGSGFAYKIEVANDDKVLEAVEILTNQKSDMSVELQQALNEELLKIYIERRTEKK